MAARIEWRSRRAIPARSLALALAGFAGRSGRPDLHRGHLLAHRLAGTSGARALPRPATPGIRRDCRDIADQTAGCPPDGAAVAGHGLRPARQTSCTFMAEAVPVRAMPMQPPYFRYLAALETSPIWVA